nr:MAG TPA: hypothetical protein [Caudoviricetes sp.]
MVLQIGKYKVSDDLKTKQKENPMLAKDVAMALYAHITGMWAENVSKHYDEVKNGERVTATFPTVCGNIVIDTLADRTQTTISME